LESASAVNPALVRLQMLRGLAEAWALRWPAQPLATRTLVAQQQAVDGGASAAQPTIPSDAEWRVAERQWQDREAAAGTRRLRLAILLSCSLADLSLRHGILRLLGQVMMCLHPGCETIWYGC
jgi:hypothetical protein